MGMNLSQGGHLSHGSPVNISGKYWNIVQYGVDDTTETIDYDKMLTLAKECQPKLIVVGASKVRVFLKNTGQFEGYNMICARAVHEYAIPRL